MPAKVEEILFKVVFDGSLTGEYDSETTKKNFAKLFKLDRKRVEVLFSGKEYVIKNNVPERVAMEFLIRLADIGCECYIQEIIEYEEEDIPEDERRKNPERRLRFRRGARPGAIVPDRRRRIRRKFDKRYYLDLKRRNHELPLALRAYPQEAATE